MKLENILLGLDGETSDGMDIDKNLDENEDENEVEKDNKEDLVI